MSDLSNAKDLPPYELAELLESIPESSAELAKRLGRSRTYVSKMRSAWRGACPSLLAAWKAGELSYDMVKRIATIKSSTEQAKALAAYQKATKGRTRAAKGEARREMEARTHAITCDLDEDCSCDDADQISVEEEDRAVAYNTEDCAQCGHMRCQHEPVCWCGDHEFVEKPKPVSETPNRKRP